MDAHACELLLKLAAIFVIGLPVLGYSVKRVFDLF